MLYFSDHALFIREIIMFSRKKSGIEFIKKQDINKLSGGKEKYSAAGVFCRKIMCWFMPLRVKKVLLPAPRRVYFKQLGYYQHLVG